MNSSNIVNKLIERLVATDFADLEGLQVTGTIPVKQDLLNEVIGDVLAGGLSTTPAAPAAAAAPKSPSASANPLRGLDVSALLKRVTKAEVTAHEGEIRLNFEIRR